MSFDHDVPIGCVVNCVLKESILCYAMILSKIWCDQLHLINGITKLNMVILHYYSHGSNGGMGKKWGVFRYHLSSKSMWNKKKCNNYYQNSN